MASINEVQYKYCHICKHNYEAKQENHVYTKRHRESVAKITSKYLTKINEAKNSMSAPDVKDSNFEEDVKVWCYFCVCEVPKHAVIESRAVCQLGLLSHLKSTNHLKKTKMFFWANRIDKDSVNQYVLSDEVYDRYLTAVLQTVKEFKASQELDHRNEVRRINENERQREHTLLEPMVPAETLTNNNDSESDHVRLQTDSNGVKLNIFTGMTPPWLQTEEEPSTSKAIVDQVKKDKLPANRVGKNFDRQATSSDWLPSFGRVWNKGTRNSSKKGFQGPEQNKRKSTSRNSNRRKKCKPYNLNKYNLL